MTKYTSIDNEELQSKTISFLRFPLIVGVILIHSMFKSVIFNGVDVMQTGSFPFYTTIAYLFSEILARIAVPLFFFISGFLFFYKTPFNTHFYVQKLKKRAKTILVPYIFWNLLSIAYYAISQQFIPELMSGRKKLICDYTFADWIWAFWDTEMINPVFEGRYPICFQLWFIRDLMVVMLLSPLIYFLVKKLKQYVIILLGIRWICNYPVYDIAGFSNTALFFFSAGAYFSIYRKNFVNTMRPLLSASIILYTILTAFILYNRDLNWIFYAKQINILIGIISAITLSAYFLKKEIWKTNSFLSDSSFFIYAYHGMVLAFIIKLSFKLIQPHTDTMLLILYFLCPTIVICGGLLLYYLLKKYLPKTTALITGGR